MALGASTASSGGAVLEVLASAAVAAHLAISGGASCVLTSVAGETCCDGFDAFDAALKSSTWLLAPRSEQLA